LNWTEAGEDACGPRTKIHESANIFKTSDDERNVVGNTQIECAREAS